MQTHDGIPASAGDIDDDALFGGPTLVQQGAAGVAPSQQGVVPHPPGMDWWLLAAVIGLSVIGIVMAFSASYFEAVTKHDDELFFLTRHLRYVAVAVLALCVGVWTPYQLWRRVTPLVVVGAVALLVAVVLWGERVNGSRRWIWGFQPVELAKLAFLMTTARSIVSKAERGVLSSFWAGLVPQIALLTVFGGLLMMQPDMGSTIVLCLLWLGMGYVGGMNLAPVGIVATLLGVGGGSYIYFFSPFRLARILAFLDPFAEANWHGKGYQLANSILAISQGGMTGLGLGASQQKLGFLPEAHTDFVLAIIGEELGVVGISLVVFFFCVLFWRGFGIIAGARDEFGRILAFGILLLLGTQAAVNLGVVVGLLPTKGLTLPFVSFGGTSLVVLSMAVGILLNVGRGGRSDFDAWWDAKRPQWPRATRRRGAGPHNARTT